ncbi:transcriptional regulator FilR1 domain-containing protein [Methanoregula sp.]|uniref:transcriptional regulator FilR1 domain-containing protein n=1 Tax=Methanoregula sp. TaxID=2052170 RepID=UPI00356794A9
MVNDARQFQGVFSIMSVEHANALVEKARGGTPMELIVNREVSTKMREEPYLEKMIALSSFNNFSVRVFPDPLHLGLAITDSSLSLGLYKNDRITYDVTTNIFSHDLHAIAWGKKVFQYYQDRSTPMKF